MHIESAYETAACSYINQKKLLVAVSMALTQGALAVATVKAGAKEGGFKIHMVQGGNSFADQVPFFNHPLYFTPVGYDEPVMVVDARNHGYWNAKTGSFVVNKIPDYAFTMRRAILSYVAIENRPEIMRDLSNIPAMTYIALMTEGIVHRYGGDPAERATISALVGFFYYGLFSNTPVTDDVARSQLIAKIAKISSVPSDYVAKALDGITEIHGLTDLCTKIVETVKNPAFNGLNLGILLTLVSGTWLRGQSREEIVAVGLEHVPTWIALCESGIVSHTYRNTSLARVAQRFDKANEGRSFVRAVDVLTGGVEAVEINGRVDEYYKSQARF